MFRMCAYVVLLLALEQVLLASAATRRSKPGGRCGIFKGDTYMCPKNYCCANTRCGKSVKFCYQKYGCNSQYGKCWQEKKTSTGKKTSSGKKKTSRAVKKTPIRVAAKTQSAASSPLFSGEITYYYGTQVMCGMRVDGWKNGTYAAISYLLADAINTNPQWPPSWCGRQARIKGRAGEAIVDVVDYCGSCNGRGDIDVSPEIFDKVTGDRSLGRTGIQWEWV